MKFKFDFLIFAFLLYFLLVGGRLFIPLVFVFVLFYIYRKLFIDKKILKLDAILLSFFGLFYPIQALLNPDINLNNLDIVEWKVYLVILIFGLISIDERKNNENREIYKNLDYKLGARFFCFIYICNNLHLSNFSKHLCNL